MSARPRVPAAAGRRAEGRRRRWSTVGALTVPAVVATLAVLHPGATVSQLDLNDGSVWLTNGSLLTLGRYNPVVDELDAGLGASGTPFDVHQDGEAVLLEQPGAVAVVDPADVRVVAEASVPAGAEVDAARGVVAVTAPDGSLHTAPLADLVALAVGSREPDVALGPGGRAVVARTGAPGSGPTGTVLAVEADGDVQRVRVGGPGAVVVPDGALAEAPRTLDAVTAVGERVAVLSGTTLLTTTAAVDLAAYGADLLVQQPGPAADVVLVATPGALLEVPLDGGSVRVHTTGGSGRAAAPVRVAGCAHGAWASGTGSYVQVCDGGSARVVDLEGMTSADELVFRVNRDVVVLNDVQRGRLWVPTQDPRLRQPNWTDVDPDDPVEEDDDLSDEREATNDLRAECTPESAAPSAVDDEYGVRPGRATVLTVIDNDAASECGILTVSEHDPVPPEFGTVVPVAGGRALQLDVLPDATGTVEFTYTVTDGRGTTAPSTATVTVTVRDGVDEPPVQVRTGTLVVEQGGSGTYRVLQDFRDPDGDELVLVGAAAPAGSVRTRPDGELTFRADAGVLGRQQVTVLVSDGSSTVDGFLEVDVRPAGSVPPVVDPVQVTAYVDEPVVVRPLRYVRSVSQEPVRLADVTQVPGAEVQADLAAGTFTFRAARTGTYYVPFLVAAAPQQTTGLARVDVVERPADPLPPVAVVDRALLPPGGEVTIDPLANDADPGGGVLVLQSVEVPEGSGVRAAVMQHRLVRLTSLRVLDAPVVLRYRVSNGTSDAVGQIVVQPVPASAAQQAPVVPDVRVSVRAGGVVTVPVLERAYDPDGDPLTVDPDLPEPLAPEDGLMFVSGEVLRYQAPATPRQVRSTFTVSDPHGNATAATVTVDVRASDAATKAPPRPRNLTARVLQGGTVRIPVPLTGIDDDGDGVLLLGEDRSPVKGIITEVGPDYLVYEALAEEAGTDTFTYAVEDWVGQRSVGTVRVGIAPRAGVSDGVVARDDHVTVRPGQLVEVRVLANDVDNGGGELVLETDLSPNGVGLVQGRRIVVRAPAEPTTLLITYTVRNLRGGSDTGLLTVDVTEDAVFRHPVARDVVVPATETVNRSSVEVDVLAVAQNPSGPMSDLRVDVPPSAQDVATVTEQGTVVVTLVDRAQTLPFRLTNAHPQAGGVASYAFITVPALGDFPPVRRPGAPELSVLAGTELVIDLAEQIQVAPGRTLRVTDPSRIQATRSDGPPTVTSQGNDVVYRPLRSYAGPAAVSVEVSDGAPGDASARTRVISLPVTVVAVEEYPPTFTPSVVDVAPGEEVPVRVDLAAFTTAPVRTAEGTVAYTWALGSEVPAGFRVRLDGSVLSVSADPSVPKGRLAGVQVRIGYGGDRVVTGQVDFRVVASSRPLARVRDHVVRDGVEGVPRSVAVLEGAYNPFAAPLTVVGATLETPGAGTVAVDGDRVTVRPAAGFVGDVVARYRVRDATGDAAREVEGRVTVVVRGRPGTPSAPRVTGTGDRRAVLAWDAPAANGEPVTEYRVTVQPGGATRTCPATTCTVEGLTNDVEHRFQVAARNAVGWSEPSDWSAPVRPDVRPGVPAPPRVERGDGTVTVTWSAPENPGSPIRGYELQVSPAPAAGPATIGTTSTSYVLTGLENGRAYTVRVRALNAAPEPGEWSGSSAPARPARAPDAPRDPAASRGLAGEGRITVTWAPPASDGGEPVAGYRVLVDGAIRADLTGDARSWTFDARRGVTYTVSVQAHNAVGWSPTATTQGEIWSAPGTVDRLSARDRAETGTAPGAGVLDVSWAPPTQTGVDGGAVDRYRVEVAGVVRELPGSTTSFTATGLVGGREQVVRVWARNTRGEWGEAATTTAVATTVAGPVTLRPADTSVPERLSFSWVPPESDGGTALREYRWEVLHDGATRSGTTTDTTVALDLPPGDARIRVWAVTARGESAAAEQLATVTAPPEPEPEPPVEPPVEPDPAP